MIICIIPCLTTICQRRRQQRREKSRLGWSAVLHSRKWYYIFLSSSSPLIHLPSLLLCLPRSAPLYLCFSALPPSPSLLVFYSPLLRRLLLLGLFCAKVHCAVWRGGVGSRSENGPWVLQSWQQCWSNLPGQAWRFHLLSLGAPCVWCELSPGITVPFFSP